MVHASTVWAPFPSSGRSVTGLPEDPGRLEDRLGLPEDEKCVVLLAPPVGCGDLGNMFTECFW